MSDTTAGDEREAVGELLAAGWRRDGVPPAALRALLMEVEDGGGVIARQVVDRVRLLVDAFAGDYGAPRFVPAREGRLDAVNPGDYLFQHRCCHVEGFPERPADGGCDGCESGSDDPADWQPLYRLVPAAGHETGDQA